MMTLDDLARRAVACKRWRWLPGMLTTDGIRLVRVDPDEYSIGYSTGGYVWALNADALPDLTDAATLGCLLALVREAHGDVVWLHHDCCVWVVCGLPEDPGGSDTQAEALVVALESAP